MICGGSNAGGLHGGQDGQRRLDHGQRGLGSRERARQSLEAGRHPLRADNDLGRPLDAEGKSKDWYIKFSSPGAKAVDLISITNGQIQCYAMAGAGGRVIEWDDKIVLDSKKLYESAQKAGGDKLAGQEDHGRPQPEQARRPHPLVLNYEGPDGKQTLSVVINARTGEVKNVFK